MDQLAVDITDIPDVTSGDIATLIGVDGTEENTRCRCRGNHRNNH